MTQPNPRGDFPGFSPRTKPYSAWVGPLPTGKARSDILRRDDDPFTGPLLARWADAQFRRLEESQPQLDLWSSISRRLET